MMKMRKITSLILALVLCVSLAVTASATMAGIYSYVSGSAYQNGHTFVATSWTFFRKIGTSR